MMEASVRTPLLAVEDNHELDNSTLPPLRIRCDKQQEEDEEEPALRLHPQPNNNSNNNNNNSSNPITTPQQHWKRLACLCVSPFTGNEDPGSLVAGLAGIVLVGSTLGLLLPKNQALPTTPMMRTLSACIGYTYFTAWSVSFYPQIFLNIKRQSTTGLSLVFCVLNVLGFACYATYNAALLYSPRIQQQYRDKYGPHATVSVQSNDVAFAVHALILSLITLGQGIYYNYNRSTNHNTSSNYWLKRMLAVGGLVVVLLLSLVVVVSACVIKLLSLSALDCMYILSYVKIAITLIKYVPQVRLNRRRQSTVGFSIWQILLDLTGGILSDAQQLLVVIVLTSTTSDVHGNHGKVMRSAAAEMLTNPKLYLGLVSIVFDSIFLMQHYVWYKNKTGGDDTGEVAAAVHDEESVSAAVPATRRRRIGGSGTVATEEEEEEDSSIASLLLAIH